MVDYRLQEYCTKAAQEKKEFTQKFIGQVDEVEIDQKSAQSVAHSQLAILSAAARIVNKHAVMTEVIKS
jgi:hypothetical protein